MQTAADAGEFYDRVCEEICRLTSLQRAALLLYDHDYRAVRPAGVHGADRALVDQIEGNLEETPMARRALEEDRVVEASDALEEHVPRRYAKFAGITTITCTPVAAGGGWLGVIFADRGGGRFELTPDERRVLMTMGRVAALAASVERGTTQREQARRLSERMALTREIHQHVIQRLFGVTMALGADGDLTPDERARCERELRGVMGELRSALARPRGSRSQTKTTLRRLLARLAEGDGTIRVSWSPGVRIPDQLEAITQSIVVEALANARKHADPRAIEIGVRANADALVVDVENDGRRGSPVQGTGLGLRLAAFEALDHRGVVEFGPLDGNRWRVRLVVPLEREA
jgi:signal transduction histidine kinase